MARKLEVEIVGDASSLNRALGSAEKNTTKYHGTLGRVGKTAGIVGAAITGGLVVGLEKSVHAALSAQTSETRLAQAFRAAHMSVTQYEPQIEKVESSSRKLGFTNEEVRKALGSLVTATGSYEKSVRMLAIAQDLARYKGVSLESATKALTMASAGSTRFLKQLGILTPTVTTAQDKLRSSSMNLTTEQGRAALAAAKLKDKHATLSKALEIVSQKVHGQAQAYAGTAAGGMAQFRAQTENLEVQLGKALIPILTKVAETLATLTDFFTKHIEATKILIGVAAAIGGILITASIAMKTYEAATIVATAAQWALNVALDANPIGAVIIAVAALAAALIILQKKYDIVTKAVQFLKKHLELLIAIPVVGWMVFLAAETVKHWGTIKHVIETAANAAKTVINALHSAVDGASSAVKTFAGWLAHKFADPAVGAAKTAFNAVENAASAASGAISAVASWLKHKFAQPALGAVEAAFNALYNAVMAVVHAVEKLIDLLSHIPHPHLPHIGLPHLASGGTMTRSGLAMVGEKGPEVLALPGGASVIPLGSSAPATSGGNGPILLVTPDGKALAEFIFDGMRGQAQIYKQRTGRQAFA